MPATSCALEVPTGELFLRFYKSIYSYADHRFFSPMGSRINVISERVKAIHPAFVFNNLSPYIKYLNLKLHQIFG